MSPNSQTVAELQTILRVGDYVDIYKATKLLAAAITEELKPVDESFLNATWASVIKTEDYESASQQGEQTLFPIPVLFAVYSDFMTALGEDLAVDVGQDDGMCDDWITESMPKSRAIATALAGLPVDYLVENSAALRAERGYTPAEVFVRSINTGESFDQSKVRIAHSTKGLNAVHPVKKS
ncbi:hypothetical protein RZ737_004105 [Escherichia coli]|nr:hypothetical protein [Escherichia coli]